jgi:hypothetical protein
MSDDFCNLCLESAKYRRLRLAVEPPDDVLRSRKLGSKLDVGVVRVVINAHYLQRFMWLCLNPIFKMSSLSTTL